MATIKTKTAYGIFNARAEFATLAEAEAFAASFPKSYRVKAAAYEASGAGAFAHMSADLRPTYGNEVNEAGERRVERFLDKAEALGHAIKHTN